MTEAILEVKGLCSGYGPVPVLHDVDLSVPAGTIAAVLGANGAGKTTLLRTLSGLVRPTSGAIRFEGHDLISVPVEKLVHKGISHVPEGRGVVTELTVDENLRLGGLWRKDRADTAKALGEMYEFFELLVEQNVRSALSIADQGVVMSLGRVVVNRDAKDLRDDQGLRHAYLGF
jgi:branched-chain amino acid transport system ATP-binding protein